MGKALTFAQEFRTRRDRADHPRGHEPVIPRVRNEEGLFLRFERIPEKRRRVLIVKGKVSVLCRQTVTWIWSWEILTFSNSTFVSRYKPPCVKRISNFIKSPTMENVFSPVLS